MVIEVLRSRLGCRRCEEGDIELLLSLLHFPKISTQYLVRIIRIIVPLLLCGKRQINFNWDIVNSEIQDDFEQGEYEDSNSENDKVNEDGKENILTKSQNGKDNINFNNELKQKGYKNEEQLDQLRLQSEDNVQTENTEKDHVRRALSILSSSDEAWRLAELQAKYNHMPAKYWVNDTFSALRNHLENDVLQIPPGLNKSILFRKLAEIVRKALQRIAEGGDTEKERAINLYQKKNIKENESQVKLDKQNDEDEEEEENVQVQTELIPLRTQSPNTADVTKILAATAASRQRAEAAAKKRAAQNLDDPYFPIRESNTQNSYERRSVPKINSK
ncbi:MAG: hypothetical protein EZS28_000920 [Streblomastix strix]|uniref:Uncharacterized protein n=1 Tax=Streblomastix strix TaxID=222440 RepID=A0A5J4X8I8_9EUKA|nr:MAG: hypothetical protein EZS28_000920 [Streblomastix strix]